MKKLIFLNLIFINFFTNLLFANNYIFESDNQRVNIIELYTSQGCNSCPPADKWLSNLKNNPKVFKEFIPMAFHVTYWNYIGWKDIFSKQEYDNRQRYYSRNIWEKNSVYTPQFIVNSKEYRTWFYNKSLPSFEEIYGGKLIANIDNELLKISYSNKKIKDKTLILNMAILGFDYRVKVNRGENRNKTLSHDFVVLKHIQEFVNIKENKLTLEKKTKLSKNEKQALVVWISDRNYNILQAVGGYLKE